jgi:hypothetical protein
VNDALSLELGGDVGIDWVSPDNDLLSLSLNATGGLSYAVLLADGTRSHGLVHLPPEAFVVLRKLVKEEE